LAFDGKKARHCEYGNLLLANFPIFTIFVYYSKKSGQEFVHFSSAWPIKMNDKTKLKDLKFKNEILFESEKRGKNKIKG
jgi:hypothetical protein